MSKETRKVPELNVSLVPVYKDKVLVLKRRDNEIWEFPGGGVEFGEEPEKSAKRELKEETNLETGEIKFIGITSAVYEKNGKKKHSVYLVYKGKVETDDFSLSLEHVEGRWVSVEEVGFMKLGINCEDIPAML